MATTNLSSDQLATPDFAWFMDSNATHHFTPEFGALMDPDAYFGLENSMVGNGKSIGISHIGNVLLPTATKPIHLHHVLHTPQISK